MAVQFGELGEPPLVVKVGMEALLNFHGVEEKSDKFCYSQVGKTASPVLTAFLAKFVKGVLSGFTPIFFAAEFVAGAADVRDPPTTVKVRFGWTWHGMLLPNKVNLAGEASRPVSDVF